MNRQARRYSKITKYRRGSRKSRKYFWIYMAICLALILIAQIKIPKPMHDNAEPGTVQEMGRVEDATSGESAAEESAEDISGEDIPEYDGEIYCKINNNKPVFTEEEKKVLTESGYEYYSALDSIGRCGYAEACVGPETQPEGEERDDIYMVHPSGWRSGQGWERCHLIAWSLTGENANDHNLVTGTHSMNVDGMLPFEIEVAEAADKGKHVMYRVAPLYKGYEPICRGVHMMAQSIEDDSVSFNIFVFNVEPGKTVDYVSGYIR